MLANLVASCVAAVPIGAARLWRAVVVRTLLDAIGYDLGSAQYAAKAITISRARAWLSRPGDPDVGLVLDLAGIEPDELRRRLPRLRQLWALADRGELPPAMVGKHGPGGSRRGPRRRKA